MLERRSFLGGVLGGAAALITGRLAGASVVPTEKPAGVPFIVPSLKIFNAFVPPLAVPQEDARWFVPPLPLRPMPGGNEFLVNLLSDHLWAWYQGYRCTTFEKAPKINLQLAIDTILATGSCQLLDIAWRRCLNRALAQRREDRVTVFSLPCPGLERQPPYAGYTTRHIATCRYACGEYKGDTGKCMAWALSGIWNDLTHFLFDESWHRGTVRFYDKPKLEFEVERPIDRTGRTLFYCWGHVEVSVPCSADDPYEVFDHVT